MQLSWFRKPGPGEPGSLNLCYNALDQHVIRGQAADAALITADLTRDFATLLQQVAELAGALAALGVKAGDQVATRLADPADALLANLACDRLGAVHGEVDTPMVLVTSSDEDDPAARVRVLRGVEPADPDRDVTWEVAVKAGRAHPAPCEPVSPEAVAFVVGGDEILTRDAIGHDSAAGQMLARLCSGGAVDLTGRS